MSDPSDYGFPDAGIHHFVMRYVRKCPDLTGKTVVDVPCGDGRASYEFLKKGANVIALDLFPDLMKLDNVEAKYADLMETLPVESSSVDYIICQEGIEHIPDQMRMLAEFNRILKKDGVLLITTPNYSHTRARLSRFLMESDFWKRMPPTEIDGVWLANDDTPKLYFGHLFLLGVQHFQTIVTMSGFKTTRRIPTDRGISSIVLGILLWPILAFFSLVAFLVYRTKNKQVPQKERDRILWNRVKLNLSPTTLFYKHIFWEMRKEHEVGDMKSKLQELQCVIEHHAGIETASTTKPQES